MKISRLTKITVFFLVGFIILLMSTLFAGRPDWQYRISETLRNPDNSLLPKELAIKADDLQKYSYSLLKSDNRIIWSSSLMLINEKYNLSDEYVPDIIPFGETEYKINSEIAESYNSLIYAVKKNCNEDLLIVSAYRNTEEQQRTIDEEGENAADVNASEHLTGLALDVCVQYYGGNAFLKAQAGRFVNSYCGEYGFIIRYPMFAKDITGIRYEPWHIRYVGLPHSEIIQGTKLTLEEYVNYFEIGEFYSFEEYIITRQPKEDIKLLEDFKSAVVSEDNTGCYIITISK